jgi:gliding motility-associated-like protein
MKIKVLIFVIITCIGLSVNGQLPECTQLTSPIEGQVDTNVFTDFEWDAATGATGYVIKAGTISGGTDILNVDVGSSTAYNVPNYLPPRQTIYVTIVSYNAMGTNTTCSEITFTTSALSPPRCTEIIAPFNGHDLVPVNSNITWIRDFTASGYLMTIFERAPNGIRVIENFDVGNGTNFKPDDFKPRTRYYVTIIPYNDAGSAAGCQPITFTTGDPIPLFSCAQLINPRNGSSGIIRNPLIEWESIPEVDGYFLNVGTTPQGTQLLNNRNVGNTTSFQLLDDLPQGKKIYIWIVPYNRNGLREDCDVFSFTTIKEPKIDLTEEIPPFFTPNNDGYNDVWIVNSSENIRVENVQVFNRFGRLIKEMLPSDSWDGTFNGKRLPSGSYWYSVKILNDRPIKGYFLLKR